MSMAWKSILIPFILSLLCLGYSAWAQTAPVFVFQGNRKYSRNELGNLIAKDWEKYLAHQQLSYIDDAAYLILNDYRRNGYYFVSVDYEVKENQVTFDIQEHNPVLVKKIDLVAQEGRKLSFSEERLRKFITPPPLLEKHYFQKTQLLKDQTAIDTFYLSEGYLTASSRIHYRFSPDPPESTEVFVEIVVEEGPRFFLDQVQFEGDLSFPEERLREAMSFKPDTVYLPGMHQDLANRLKDFYKEQGYARIEIKPDVYNLEGKTPSLRMGKKVLFRVLEGEKNRIRTISIAGNEMTDPSVIFRQMDILEGDSYNVMKIRGSKQNLNDIRIFNQVEIEEKWVEEDQVDLVIQVKERNSKSITFNLGYDTTYGVIGGFNFEHINLFGTYRQFLFSLDSSIVASELFKSEASIQLRDPQLFSVRTLAGQIRGFALYEETPTYDLFDRGVGIMLEKKLTEELSVQFGYHLLWSQILELKGDMEQEEEKGTTFFATLQEKIILNFRDSNAYPTSGSYHFIELEESLTALAAEIDYFKIYGHTAWYFRIVGRCVLSVALRGGVIAPFGKSDRIPIQKRFFSGGVDSVRSFKTKEIPPLNDQDKPTGGEGLFLLSTELRIPIYGNFGISLFGDSGQIIPVVRRFKDYRISHMKYAVGVSLWYNTPIGPLRFDMGINPDREENPLTGTKEELFAWFISIGFSY